MATWLQHRLKGEDGLSLVEMMVALLILMVSMFALLSGLIASARSVLDQQLRAEATRVGTQALEATRTTDFEDLDEGTTTQTVNTANGRELTLERTVEFMDAFDPEGGDNEDVKLVTVVVSWSDRERDRDVTYTTAIAPPDPEVVGGQSLAVALAPGAVEVDGDGLPQETVTLTASPQGFVYIGNMSARWNRQDGSLASEQVPQVSPDTWQVDLPAEDLTWTLDPGDTVEIEIEVVAGGRSGLALLTLVRPLATAPGPSLSDATVAPDPIYLTNPPGGSNNCSSNHCRNVDPVSLSVEVTPFDDDQVVESVYVEFDLRDATSPTQFPLTLQGDDVTWLMEVDAEDIQFAPGTSQPFNFVALYDGGQETPSLTVLREVVHQ